MTAQIQPPMNDLDYIKSRFNYDSGSGILTWKEHPDGIAWWNGRYAGKPPTATDALGYLRAKISYGEWAGYVSVHRICFFIYHGYLPEVVDHIDGDVRNNSIDNLRAANWQSNTWNRDANRGTKTGYKGVHIIKPRTKGSKIGYVAKIGHNGDREYLGYYDTPEEARDAYLKREQELRSEYARNCSD